MISLFVILVLNVPCSTEAYCALFNPSWFGSPSAKWNETTGAAEVTWGSMVRRKKCIDGFRVKFENIKARVTLHQADMACVVEGVKALISIAEETRQSTEVFQESLRQAEATSEIARAKILPYQFIESPELDVSVSI